MKHVDLVKKNRKELEKLLAELEEEKKNLSLMNGLGFIETQADIEKVKYVLNMKNIRRGR